MLIPRLVVALCSAGILVASVAAVHGQNYPSKPVHIVTGEPGGSNDFAARVIAQGLSGSFGQVVVENKGGASGIVGAELVAKSPPDGYTVLLYGSPLWLLPFMQSVPYDPMKDFVPVTLAIRSPNVVVVHPSLPAHSISELIALAKAKPGALNYASSATGGSPHLAAELFNAMAGINTVQVPYKGAGPAVIAVVGGQVQLMFPNAGSAAPHLKSGKLRALAVTSAQPSDLLPGLPTVAASGVPGYEAVSMFGVFAPARTPAPLVTRLNQEIVRVLKRPEAKDKFSAAGVEVVASTPEELMAAVKAEMTLLGKVIKDAGIRAD